MLNTLDDLIAPRTTTVTEFPALPVFEEFVSRNATQYMVKRVVESLSSLMETRTGYDTVTDTSDRNFPLSLRRIQASSDLSWGEIARTIGVSRRTVHNWLTGTKVNGMNATRVASLHSAIMRELTYVPHDQARSHLLAPGPDGITPLSRLTRYLRAQSQPERPVIGGFDLLRSPSSSEQPLITGGLDESIPVVVLDDASEEGT
jgi:DNA-binding transcriptional regulator YiaG